MTRKKGLLWLCVVGLIAVGQVLGDVALFIFLPVAYLFRGEKTNFVRVMRMPAVAVLLIVYYAGLVASVLIFDVNLARADLVSFFVVVFGPVFLCGFVSDLMEGREDR